MLVQHAKGWKMISPLSLSKPRIPLLLFKTKKVFKGFSSLKSLSNEVKGLKISSVSDLLPSSIASPVPSYIKKQDSLQKVEAIFIFCFQAKHGCFVPLRDIPSPPQSSILGVWWGHISLKVQIKGYTNDFQKLPTVNSVERSRVLGSAPDCSQWHAWHFHNGSRWNEA